MARTLEKQPATKADLAEMSQALGERIGSLEERVDRIEGTLEVHSKLLTNISRTVERIDQKLTGPGGFLGRLEKLESRVTILERGSRRSA